jgi:hypothetical protein
MNILVEEVLGRSSETSGSPEERREVQLANAIVVAARRGDRDQIIALASELIRMHDPATAASYEREMSKLNV